jgi:hypothetical protein
MGLGARADRREHEQEERQRRIQEQQRQKEEAALAMDQPFAAPNMNTILNTGPPSRHSGASVETGGLTSTPTNAAPAPSVITSEQRQNASSEHGGYATYTHISHTHTHSHTHSHSQGR